MIRASLREFHNPQSDKHLGGNNQRWLVPDWVIYPGYVWSWVRLMPRLAGVDVVLGLVSGPSGRRFAGLLGTHFEAVLLESIA